MRKGVETARAAVVGRLKGRHHRGEVARRLKVVTEWTCSRRLPGYYQTGAHGQGSGLLEHLHAAWGGHL